LWAWAIRAPHKRLSQPAAAKIAVLRKSKMTMPLARMLVYAGEQFACIKIVGRANFSFSLDFKTLVTELRRKDCAYFVIDLSECLLMDSTFLGTLADLGLKLNSGSRAVELLQPNERIAELLESLGMLDLFKIAHEPVWQTLPAQPSETIPAAHSRAEVTRACLEAHQTLISVNPDNAAKFKDVTQFLAEDLKRLEKS